jgi:hypothetical protein
MNQKHILPCPRFLVFLNLFFAPKFFPPTYLNSFCSQSIVKARESLKWEGKNRRVNLRARSGRLGLGVKNGKVEVATKIRKVEVVA